MITPLTATALDMAHGFFTRLGGVSEGPFASLNCSLSSADDREAVLENRARAARAIGAAPERLLGLTQVHGIDVAVAEQSWQPGEGPRADAVVTRQRGLALAIVTADCAPVLFADPELGVIGAAHAGWRSAVGGVLEATLAAMRVLGAGRIVAAIGPCIRQPSYEVGADLRDAVLVASPDAGRHFGLGVRPERWQFDLAGYCAARLSDAGAEVAVLGADTLTDSERFFSHRRRTLHGGGPIGHQISAIVL
jgi:YfiH family protein